MHAGNQHWQMILVAQEKGTLRRSQALEMC
jgi:hypothetical protein